MCDQFQSGTPERDHSDLQTDLKTVFKPEFFVYFDSLCFVPAAHVTSWILDSIVATYSDNYDVKPKEGQDYKIFITERGEKNG